MKSTMSARRPSQAEQARDRMLRDVTASEVGQIRRLSVELPLELAKEIKIRAATEDRTISDITRALWVEYLNK